MSFLRGLFGLHSSRGRNYKIIKHRRKYYAFVRNSAGWRGLRRDGTSGVYEEAVLNEAFNHSYACQSEAAAGRPYQPPRKLPLRGSDLEIQLMKTQVNPEEKAKQLMPNEITYPQSYHDFVAGLPYAPSEEQVAVVNAAVSTKENLLISALAGAAKTSTLKLLAHALPDVNMICLAFNKAIATEMAAELPSNCTSMTLNSLGHRVWGQYVRTRHLPQQRQDV